jgi:hypothetical protein
MDQTVGEILTAHNHIYRLTQHTALLQPSTSIAVDVRNACLKFYINFVHLVSVVLRFIMSLGSLQFTSPVYIVYTYLLYC